MGTIIIHENEPIDINEKIDGLIWNEDNSSNFIIPANLYIMQQDETVAQFSNGKGFSFIKRSDIEGVFIDISIGDTSFMTAGEYVWKINILDNNGDKLKDVEGNISILNAPEREIQRTVKPWDLINDNSPKVSKEIRDERFSICKSCERYKLGFCLECGCVMGLKTMLAEAYCPLHKWEAEN